MYCSLVEFQCVGVETVAGVEILEDYDVCLDACRALPRTPQPFNFSMSSGDSLECRFWHVQATFGDGAKRTHCVHAVGLATCVP